MFWDMLFSSSQSLKNDEGDGFKSQASISPLLAAEHLFHAHQWPPTSFHIAGIDALKDEGVLFERKLRNIGIKTRLHMYEGFPHAFNMLPQLRESKKWRKNMLDFLLSVYGRE